ncbi:hypothetical protein NPIL_223711 [Nephila pilipes]|uniref:Uncharacterized protein n=1 Tax=Nephila pilipes TaxID=299642 RepID=A0A8X6Q3X3_NEPPI|nr:hypothetical protein NPIL_223711 [Nephila pilipes]
MESRCWESVQNGHMKFWRREMWLGRNGLGDVTPQGIGNDLSERLVESIERCRIIEESWSLLGNIYIVSAKEHWRENTSRSECPSVGYIEILLKSIHSPDAATSEETVLAPNRGETQLGKCVRRSRGVQKVPGNA